MPTNEFENEKIVHVAVGDKELEGALVVPKRAKAIVIFAHGSGSSRHSPRNKFVAQELNKLSLATLLIDLLTETEDRDYSTRFDIALLARRLATVTDWVVDSPATKNLRIGYFGASTGAAAAIIAAASQGGKIGAVVSRGGRVDLAPDSLSKVVAPTLLIVGEYDFEVLEINRQAYQSLTALKEIVIVPKATHLFEEAGALSQVAKLAGAWFCQHIKQGSKKRLVKVI